MAWNQDVVRVGDRVAKIIKQKGKLAYGEIDPIVGKMMGWKSNMTDKESDAANDFLADVSMYMNYYHGINQNMTTGDYSYPTKKYLKYSVNPMKQYKMKQAKLNRLSRGY